jgi:serine/threonine protein kinase
LTYLGYLGSGGYADVYLYEQENPRMRVAVKVLSGEVTSPALRRQFTAEADAMARLADHPYIVQVIRTDNTADGRPFLVMRYYPKANLAVRARSERLSVPEVIRIGVQITCAVETAHRVGILHRDIKPANILTSQYDAPGLTDFGIATTTGDSSNDEADGVSIPWAPPESLFGNSPPDERSDVYSLGATLWHLLVGRSPFEIPGGDNSSFALMQRKREPPPRTNREDVPASLERVLAQTMAVNPDNRPPTALSLARLLQAIEIEQRWAPTSLALLDDNAQVTETPDSNLDDRTRVRSPQQIVAQPPISSRFADPIPDFSPPDAPTEHRRPRVVSDGQSTGRFVVPPISAVPDLPPAPPPNRQRESSPSEKTAARTVVRPVQPVAPVNEVIPVKPRPTRLLIGAGVALVVVAGVLGAVLVGGSSSGSSHQAGSSAPGTTVEGPSGQNALAGEDQVPGTPNVKATRVSPTVVRFSWTYSNHRAGDEFRWQLVNQPWTNTHVPYALVNDPTGHQVCIDVQVGRADGSSDSSVSDPPTCED